MNLRQSLSKGLREALDNNDNVGPKKPDQGFNDRLKDIKRSHRGSNINIYY